MKTLKSRILSQFDVFIPESSSSKAIIQELDRRGKIDNKKLLQLIFVLLEAIEALEERVSYKSNSNTKEK